MTSNDLQNITLKTKTKENLRKLKIVQHEPH